MTRSESLSPVRQSIEDESDSSDESLSDEDVLEEVFDDVLDDEGGRKTHVRAACTACKKRKLKCSGTVPCEKCEKAGLECDIDEEGDQRRKQVLKRKIESVEDKGGLLDRLVLTLQEADRASAMEVVNMIRSHASLEEIRGFLDDLLQRPKLEKTPELIDACSGVREWHERQKEAAGPRPSDEHSSNMSLFNVPARPWTTVTENDDFISHLVSLWFTWEHPFLNWIDRDMFIRDMESGSLDAQFCSPFLVNIILASACAYSDHEEAYTVASEEWSRGLHFYKEAKSLLDTDDGNITVPYVQGLGVMYVCSCMIGKDRVGWVYISQLAYAARELASKYRFPPKDADEDTMQNARATEHTLWGVFNLIAMTSLSYQKGSMMKAPRWPPPANSESEVAQWTNYPARSEPIQSNCEPLFGMFCEVSRITYDLSWSLFGDDETKPTLGSEFVKMTDDAYSRLKAWYEGFPECLRAVNSPPPHVLSFHMKYHTIVQTVFGVVKDLPTNEDDNIDPAWEKQTRERARRLCVESARETARLIDVHRDSWTLDRMAPVNIHWVTVSMFTLLPYLEESENQTALISLIVAARAYTHQWSLGKAMLRVFQVTAKQKEVKLPMKAEELLNEFEQKEWSVDERKGLSSQYPNFANSMKRGQVDEVELDKFLDKFDELYITEQEEELSSDYSSGLE